MTSNSTDTGVRGNLPRTPKRHAAADHRRWLRRRVRRPRAGQAGRNNRRTQGSMLYTPLLPEVAAGAIEPRHVAIPLRQMCPQAELVLGRVVALDEASGFATVETDTGRVEIEYDDVVVALGAVARMPPIPVSPSTAAGFKNLADAIHLRNHILGELAAAEADPATARAHLTFVFVGAGLRGWRRSPSSRTSSAMFFLPGLADAPQRWVLVDAGDQILAEAPDGLGEYAAKQLARRGTEIQLSTRLTSAEARRDAVGRGGWRRTRSSGRPA